MQPLVSICITTYQHYKFIEKAVNSVINQVTSFDFEILIGEDGSIDGTREIVQSLEKKSPNLIRGFYHNRKSQNNSSGNESMGFSSARENYLNNLKEAKGKYIAVLDGDDYWASVSKLELQVNLLENREDLSACFSIAEIVNEKDEKTGGSLKPQVLKSEYDIHDLLIKNEFCSATFLFRRETILEIPAWFHSMPGVFWPTCILCGLSGNFGFIPQPLAHYRVHERSVHNSLSFHKKNLLAIEGRELLKSLLDEKYIKSLNQGLLFQYRQLMKSKLSSKELNEAQEMAKKQLEIYKKKDLYTLKLWLMKFTFFCHLYLILNPIVQNFKR